MKFVYLALTALLLLNACGKSSNNPNTDGRAIEQQKPGFTTHAWCYAYSDQGQYVQDRFMFNNGGTLNFQKYAWTNQRGALLGQADGQWQLNGSVLTLWISNRRLDYQVQYIARDPQTGVERVYVQGPDGNAPYDPCN